MPRNRRNFGKLRAGVSTAYPVLDASKLFFSLGHFAGMSAVEKVKIALDECRMLALGAQVLIGFQFQSVFQPKFQDMPASSKAAHVVGLVLLLASLGSLVA